MPEEIPPIAKLVSEQLNRLLSAKLCQSEIIDHNLEKGQGNEQALRDLLISYLPKRFGVGKGKVTNSSGQLSRQADIIIYDALNCPTMFIDENENQILPIEGVYKVIEVKTTLTSSTLRDAFTNLLSVHELGTRKNRSKNKMVCHCPPSLSVFAFSDARKLRTIFDQYDKLSKEFEVDNSFHSYSKKSPGFRRHTGRNYLVSDVHILGKGYVHHMLDGSPHYYEWGEYTLGMFMTGIVDNFQNLHVSKPSMMSYLNWIMVDNWLGTDHSRKSDKFE